jgi:hypothetical protein
VAKSKKKYKVKPPIERFNKKYTIDVDSDCWVWHGCVHPNGYGRFSFEGQGRWAHRVSYILHKGDIPEGLVIDHLCRNTRCVNPEHLEAVTQQENRLRGKDIKERCPHGVGKLKCPDGCGVEYRRESHLKNRERNLARMRKRYWDNLEAEKERKRVYYQKTRGIKK